MRILFSIDRLTVGGAQLTARDLAGEMAARGHDVLILAEPGPLVQSLPPGVDWLRAFRGNRAKNVWTINRASRSFRADVVQAFGHLTSLEAFVGAQLLNGVPTIGSWLATTPHVPWPAGLPYIAFTPRLVDEGKRLGIHHGFMMQPPVSTSENSLAFPHSEIDRFRARWDLPEGDQVVTLVSRLANHLKLDGVMDALDAIRAIATEDADVRLLVVGAGDAQDAVRVVADEINESNARTTVVATGELIDPRPAYAAASVVVGMGISAIRGLAFGKPTIVVGLDGFAKTVTPESAGWFLEQGMFGVGVRSSHARSASLETELKALLASPDERRRLGEFSREFACAHYSLGAAASELEGIYGELHAKTRRQRVLEAADLVPDAINSSADMRVLRWVPGLPPVGLHSSGAAHEVVQRRRETDASAHRQPRSAWWRGASPSRDGAEVRESGCRCPCGVPQGDARPPGTASKRRGHGSSSRWGGGRVGWIRRTGNLIDAVQPDLVHTTLFESDIAGRVAAKVKGRPAVSSLVNVPYGPEHLSDPSLTRWRVKAAWCLDAYTSRWVRRFHALSGHVADVMAERLRIDRVLIDVIPRGRDPEVLGRRTAQRREQVRAALGVPDHTRLVLAVGRHEYQKAYDVVLEALAELIRRRPDCRLLVAGREGNDTKDICAHIDRLALGDRVDLLGARADVADLMVAADVFVLASRREGLGSVLIEAMATETPIVATNIGPIAELFTGQDIAELVPSEDPSALAEGIIRMVDPSPLRERRTRSGRQLFLGSFTLDAVVNQMMAFYQRAVLEAQTEGAIEVTDAFHSARKSPG